MKKLTLVVFVMALVPAGMLAADGQVLINQSTVLATGGFPYKITQPGSYKLSGNLNVTAAGVDAIYVTASNVVLDLNGFTINGPSTCFAASACCPGGVCAPGNGVNEYRAFALTVENGTIQGFVYGVYGLLFTKLVDVQLYSNGVDGAFANNGVVSRCEAEGNGRDGISGGFVVSNSMAISNLGDGFDGVAVLTDSLSSSNGRYAIEDVGSYGGNWFGSTTLGNVGGAAGVSHNDNVCYGTGRC